MADDSDYEFVSTSDENGVTLLRLERPEKKNAINDRMRAEIREAIDRFEDADTRVLAVTGSADSFSAGADIGGLKERLPDDFDEAVALDQYSLPDDLAAVDDPTVALINGLALGGGLELALACDVQLASSDATVGFPEITIAGMPGEGGTQRLTAQVGTAVAKRLVLTGDTLDAEAALAHGVVQEVYDAPVFEDEATALAERIADHERSALRLATAAIDLAERTDVDAGSEIEGLFASLLEVSPQRRARLDEFLGE